MRPRCAAALVAVLAAPAALAQPGPRTSVDVPAQPLAEALRRVAAAADLNLSYDPALVRGQTGACRLANAPPEALLACVLRGTGLVAVRTGPRSFTLARAPDPAPRAAPPHPVPEASPTVRSATLVGVVVDAGTRRGLEGAVVLLGRTGTATASSGQFALEALPPGRYTLRASHVGYAPAVLAVELRPGGRHEVRLALRPRDTELPQVVVDGLSTLARSERLGLEDARAVEVATRDEKPTWPTRPAAALADFRVQGLAEGDYQLTLDGATVFAPPSVLGIVGPFAPLAIGRVTAQKAAFGVALGASASGLVEASHAASTHAEAVAYLDPFAAEARWTGPLDPRRAAHALLTVRGSMPATLSPLSDALAARVAPDPLLSLLLRPDPLAPPGAASGWGTPRSTLGVLDLHAAVQATGRGVRALSASAHYGQRRLDTRYPDAPVSADTDARAWQTYTLQASARTALGGTTLARLTASVAGVEQRHQFRLGGADTPTDAQAYPTTHRALEAGLDGRLDVAVTTGVRAEVGTSAAVATSDLSTTGLTGLPYAHRTAQPRLSAFADLRLAPAPFVQAELGARLTYLPARRQAVADPHLTLRLDGPRSPVGPWAARLAAGLFHSYVVATPTPDLSPASPAGTARLWLVPDTSVGLPRGEHYAAELRVDPAPWLGVQLDTYYRRSPLALVHTPPVAALGRVPLAALTESGVVVGYGREVTVEVNRPRVSVQGRYGRHVERRAHPFDPERYGPPPRSRPSSASLLVAARPVPSVEVSARLSRTPYDGWAYRLAYYAAAEARAQGLLDPARADAIAPFVAAGALEDASATLPATVRLDLGVAAQRRFRHVHALARLDVLNALDRSNPDEQRLDASGQTRLRPTLPLTLAASLRLTWQAPEPAR